ncbi:hypothetical protein IKF43_02755 [Candidatus Saccharibacteria bacterium]|nr:hypothetical protein [Candidatus Saccharibacteria bacterium]
MGHKLTKVYLYSVALLILGFIVSISSYSNVPVFADKSNVDKLTLNLPVSCTIDGGSSSTHTQSVINNQYYPNLGGAPTTFTMYCNDKDGFIVYARGASDGTEGNTNLVGTSGSNIATGVYDPDHIDTTTSSWSFKLGNTDGTVAISSGYNDNLFHTIPSTWTEIAKKQSGTVDSTTGSKITATYDAYISGTQASGTYTGQVKYVMFHPSSAVQPTTLAEAFKNAGKSKVPIVDPSTGETNYYYKMQDMSSSICNAANVFGTASDLEVVDTRDNSIYWVTKLKTDYMDDNVGQCWMTENLDLDFNTTKPDGSIAMRTFTSNDTNLTLYGSYGYDSNNGYTCSNTATTTNCTSSGEIISWTPERATIAPEDLSSTTWKNDNSNPYSYDRGNVEPDGYKDGHGKAGNYYNWTATIASNSSNSYTSGNATNSICPKGWRLPDTRTYEFSKLLYAYDITKDDKNTAGYADGSTSFNKMVSSPLYFVRSGYVNNGSLSNSAGSGDYWSSAVDSASFAFDQYFNSSSVRPAYSNSGSYGLSVRCLAE